MQRYQYANSYMTTKQVLTKSVIQNWGICYGASLGRGPQRRPLCLYLKKNCPDCLSSERLPCPTSQFKFSMSRAIKFLLQCYIFLLLGCINMQKIIEKWDHDFTVYWNLPTFQCAPHKISFVETAQKFHIVQNQNDSFRGDKIAILYDPGNFPAILRVEGTKKYVLRNGGVPQEGNLTLHMEIFTQRLEELIPDGKFNGLAIIDFESWRPIFRQNFGALTPYRDLSIDIERHKHPLWTEAVVRREATKRFEASGRVYVQRTLDAARRMRPHAKWGYYAYPYCFNMRAPELRRECPAEVRQENDRVEWLFEDSDVLYPSIYLTDDNLNESDRVKMVEGRIMETQRIIETLVNTPKIIPYMYYKYQDNKNFVSQRDLRNVIMLLKALRVDGVVLWGSSKDVDSKAHCKQMYTYINEILGPIL